MEQTGRDTQVRHPSALSYTHVSIISISTPLGSNGSVPPAEISFPWKEHGVSVASSELGVCRPERVMKGFDTGRSDHFDYNS